MPPGNRSKAKQKLERRARRQDIDRQQHSEAKPRPDSDQRRTTDPESTAAREWLWFHWLADEVLAFAERNPHRRRGIFYGMELVDKRFASGSRAQLQSALLQLSRHCEGSGIDFSGPERWWPEPGWTLQPLHQFQERLTRLECHIRIGFVELDELRPHEHLCDPRAEAQRKRLQELRGKTVWRANEPTVEPQDFRKDDSEPEVLAQDAYTSGRESASGLVGDTSISQAASAQLKTTADGSSKRHNSSARTRRRAARKQRSDTADSLTPSSELQTEYSGGKNQEDPDVLSGLASEVPENTTDDPLLDEACGDQLAIEHSNGDDENAPKTPLGRGLINNDNSNCFLNVILQTLWHIPAFRGGLLSAPEHEHPDGGTACITCALRHIFAELSLEKEGPVAVSPLRDTLNAQHAEYRLEMWHDVVESRQLILGSLHDESGDERCRIGSECLAHDIFGVSDLEQAGCILCRGQHLRWFVGQTECASVEETLNSSRAACTSCGEFPVAIPPAVLAIDIVCDSRVNSAREATLKAIRTEIAYAKERYRLFCMVSYGSFHYTCFCLEENGWVHWNDAIAKVYRDWEAVVESEDLQFPTTLFYEKRQTDV